MDSEYKLLERVRETTGYTSDVALSDDGLETAFTNAKRKIRVAKGLDADYDWFSPDRTPAEQDALFWFTCLFTKVQTGELDSQELSVGAVSQDTLTATNDGDFTQWYSNAVSALRSFNPSTLFSARGATRGGRNYEADTYRPEASVGSNSNSTEVSGDDI